MLYSFAADIMGKSLSVLVMDDAPVVRRLIVKLVNGIKGVDTVLQAGDAPSAVALMEEHSPEIAILDIKVPGGKGLRNGIDVLRAMKVAQPDMAVIMLTNHAIPRYKTECEQAGANYFFDKSSEFDKLPLVIEELVEGLLS
jgi:DNA-binding NarL/FixJ family response regulator